ncbi:MAG: TIGR00180 family glycosyltransferase [Bacteroidia bacterium]|nr:TIGR00180 family glycosyltransferase [Bacteroidia bacterium]
MKKVTVIIPTYNRHQYLARILKYYSQFNVDVCVADSSKQPFAFANNFNAKYYHLPEFSYFKKIQWVTEQTSTPYLCLCADDDFTIPSALSECIKFLEENPDYFSAQGKSIFYKIKRNRSVKWWPCHLYIFGFNFASSKEVTERVNDFSENSALKRVDALWKHYVYLYYSVHRRENIEDIFNLSADFDFDIYAASMEFFFNNIAIANGKHIILPHLFQVREYSQASGTFTLQGIRSGYSIEDMYHTYRSYFEPLITHIHEKEPVSEEELKKKIISPFQNWINSVPEHLSSPIKRPLLRRILNQLPFIHNIKQKYSDMLYKKYAPLNYYFNNISKFRTLWKKGFPLTDKTSKMEWNKIKKLIRQFSSISE